MIEISKSILYNGGEQGIEAFEPLEFLARLTPHIPLRYESITRYYGEYSYRRRGRHKKLGVVLGKEGSDDIRKNKHISSLWAALIQRIFEVDPLECPRCGAPMKIISFITDTTQIPRLLDSLGTPRFRAPPKLKPPPGQIDLSYS